VAEPARSEGQGKSTVNWGHRPPIGVLEPPLSRSSTSPPDSVQGRGRTRPIPSLDEIGDVACLALLRRDDSGDTSGRDVVDVARDRETSGTDSGCTKGFDVGHNAEGRVDDSLGD
jgi:hypothetical protein